MAVKLTLVIPTKNASQHISESCESIVAQQNCHFEVIFVDAESTDGTLDCIASFKDPRFRIQSVPFQSTLFEMINRGIKLASGEYVQVFFPGDCFLFVDALATLLWQIEEHNFPDLFYTASFIQDDAQERRFFFRALQKKLLSQGLQPASLQATCFKKTLFQKSGYFDVRYQRRAAFDFFIRFLKVEGVFSASEMRVYVELNPMLMNARFIIQNLKETFRIILAYFGLFRALAYLCRQREMRRLLTRAKRRVKLAFQRG